MREQASAWKGVSSLARPVSVVRSHSEEAGFLKRALRFVIGGGRSGKGPSSVVPSVSKIDGDRLARYTEKVSCCLARMLVWLVLADPSSHESRNLITMVLDDGILEALSKVASSSEPPSAPGQTPRYDKLIILEGLVRGLSLSPACKGFTLSIHRAESLAYEIRRKWIDPHGLSGAPSDPTQLRRMSLFGNTVRGRLEEESTILMAFQRLRRSSTLAHLRTARGGDRASERRLSLLVTAVATVTENDASERNEKSRLRIRNDLGAILGLPPERLQSRSSSVDMCPPGNPVVACTVMASVDDLLKSVEKTQKDVQSVKGQVQSVADKLKAIKVQVDQRKVAAGGAGGTAAINAVFVQKELDRARGIISKFMAMIQPPADGEGSGPQDEAVSAAQATIDMLAKRKNATDDLSRPLFERLGGDTALEACIGLVYAKALQDPRTRAYFEKNQRKIDSIKKKMHQFLSGQFGGASKYDLDDLKMMHYQMNITDFQFDVMSELFHHTFEAVGAHPNAVKDAMRAIGQVRKAITTGCTVRMELARRSIEKGKDGLYRRLGAAEGIKTFMDRVYELVVNDYRLKTYFADKDVEEVKNSQLVWITQALGGPKTWQGKDLQEVHKDLGVNDYLFDCFIMNCQKALNGLGVEEDVMDEVLVSLEPARDGVLCRSSGLSTTSKVVGGRTVLERLGGEMNLEAVIETMYTGCLLDPRVKYFFSKDTSKMTHIKSKMVQLLTGMLGGPQLYPVYNLRPAHYGLNITDYQFDAVLENFQVAANIMEVEPAVKNDMVEVVRFTRSPITCGCTVRLEIARKKAESQGTEALISILGGQEGVVNWVAKVYDRVLVDDRVKHFFQGSKLDAVMESQGKYFQQLFGASSGYRGRDLPEIHSTIQISDFHFDSFMESCREAFQAMGVDNETIDDCTVLMESLRLQIVNKQLMNHDVKRALEMANQKPLYDRLGGENSLEKLIDLAYDKALQDDRLRSFFEKNKAKVTTIKKKMTQFIGGLIGGPVTYDGKDLLPAHYGMNITNFHFDVMLTILATTLLNDIGVEKALARELMSALQPVRSDVTKGFTVRGEIAKKKVVEDGIDHFLGRMGGRDGLLKVIDSLYEILAEDARVKEFFGGGVLERIRDSQTAVLVELLGGPKTYRGAVARSRDLVAVHKTLGVTDYHFDAFLVDFHKALSGGGLDEDLIDAVIITLEPLRDTVLGRDLGESALAQQMKQKNGKPVIERLGGDMNLETIVEGMYEKAQVDDRLKFFLDRGKQKVRQIKQKMYQLMCGALGGPTLYDLNKLKPAHYSMNITDFHFDAILACFADTCQEMDVDADTVDDACLVLNGVRSDITAGCTVRMELAKRRSQVDGDDQLFARLGGMEGVEDVVTRLY
ncbi:hypothetical protein FOZ63_011121, partial [Perkinsus olseni]